MTKTRIVLAVIVLSACDTPDLKIRWRVADGSFGQACGTNTCEELPMLCDSVLHVRVLSPSDPNVPHLSICKEVPKTMQMDLCAISGIELPRETLPRETLEVQMTVWPRNLVTDPETDKLDCARIPVVFDATMGFPISVPGPAFGGRAFYHPGDSETVVTLGCTDVQSINDTSCGIDSLLATASVLDFKNPALSVSDVVSKKLTVFVGEPQSEGIDFALNGANLTQLDFQEGSKPPSWAETLAADRELATIGCIAVAEDGGQVTTSVRCKKILNPDSRTFDFAGVRLGKESLDEVLDSIDLTEFPEEGLTIGIVTDEGGTPISGLTVGSTLGTIEYVNAMRTGTIPNMTSSSGIFVSRDAPFNTVFSAQVPGKSAQELGGRLTGRATIVRLQLSAVVGGN